MIWEYMLCFAGGCFLTWLVVFSFETRSRADDKSMLWRRVRQLEAEAMRLACICDNEDRDYTDRD